MNIPMSLSDSATMCSGYRAHKTVQANEIYYILFRVDGSRERLITPDQWPCADGLMTTLEVYTGVCMTLVCVEKQPNTN